MESKTSPWQARFGLKTCAATELNTAIPSAALGVAVIYAKAAAGEIIYLVLESRAGSLRDFCLKRLQTAKLPPASELTVSFKGALLADTSPETVSVACREQVILAGELRRELRPAMR
jgi:hypothetical protein